MNTYDGSNILKDAIICPICHEIYYHGEVHICRKSTPITTSTSYEERIALALERIADILEDLARK